VYLGNRNGIDVGDLSLNKLGSDSGMLLPKLDKGIADYPTFRMSIGDVYRFTSRGKVLTDRMEYPEYMRVKPIPLNNRFYLESGVYLVRCREYVKIPNDCIGLVLPNPSLIGMGATLQTTIWTPGYEGYVTGLLVVYNMHGIELEHGAQIGQMILVKTTKL